MSKFHYEWWTVNIKYPTGTRCREYKGKNKDGVIKQIKKEIKYTNSPENLNKPILFQDARIVSVDWDTLKLDRIGYQRKF